jgi:predicted phosphate transport protein (TIGR00153 family)
VGRRGDVNAVPGRRADHNAAGEAAATSGIPPPKPPNPLLAIFKQIPDTAPEFAFVVSAPHSWSARGGFMKFFLPREDSYFELLEQATHYLVKGATALEDLAADFTNIEGKINHLQGMEHACDEICHNTLDKLNKTFITPIDREDIHELVLRLDDVLDMTTSAAQQMVSFRVTTPRRPVQQFATIIRQQCELLKNAVSKLRDTKAFESVTNDCIEIHRLENDADDILKHVIEDLFDKETNAIELLRWKEIYETLESVTDKAEDVANVIQGITVKMS